MYVTAPSKNKPYMLLAALSKSRYIGDGIIYKEVTLNPKRLIIVIIN